MNTYANVVSQCTIDILGVIGGIAFNPINPIHVSISSEIDKLENLLTSFQKTIEI